MSSFAGYCTWCEKPVMHKTFFGTLHLCLTEEERVARAMIRQQQAYRPSLQQLLGKNNLASKPASNRKANLSGGTE